MNALQQTTEPLFPNLIWSRPETKLGAGKLLLLGGQAQEFIHVAESYAAAEQAGAGTVRVLMPESTRKVTRMLPTIEYAPSNISGSFGKNALAEIVDASLWSDSVLIAGDLGKNSETNLMLEHFIVNRNELTVIASKAMESITLNATELFAKDELILTLTFDQIQKFGIELGLEKAITTTIGVPEFTAILHQLTTDFSVTLVIQRGNSIWTAYRGNVAITSAPNAAIGAITSAVAVWCMQNSTKRFEAATTAVWQQTHA